MQLTVSPRKTAAYTHPDHPELYIPCRTLTGTERVRVLDCVTPPDDVDGVTQAEVGTFMLEVCQKGVCAGVKGLENPETGEPLVFNPKDRRRFDYWSEQLITAVGTFIWDGCQLTEEQSGNSESDSGSSPESIPTGSTAQTTPKNDASGDATDSQESSGS